jgi:nucleotide-binding universal stress UspA family protein
MAGNPFPEGQIAAAAQRPAARLTSPHILLAYDGSEHAQAALDLAIDLFSACAAGEQCRLTAITVLPTQYIGGHEALQRSLDQAKQKLELANLPADAILKAGNPAVSINAYAEEINADLILMGAQGLRATLGILLGGVVQQVVEYSQRPVLVVRAPYRGLRRVLVAVDGSWHSQRLVDYLAPRCEEQKELPMPRFHAAERPAAQTEKQPPAPPRRRCSWLPPDVQATLMFVLPPPISEITSPPWMLTPEALYPAPPLDLAAMQAEEEEQARRTLNEALEAFQSAGLAAETTLRHGDAATEILQFAKERDVDLIACGSRGLNPVSGWLLGSVSRKLVHYAPCSVLIAK